MKLIKKISEMIDEEVQDAEKYIKCALNHKDEHPSLARIMYQLSEEELVHANKLHGAVVDIIEDYRREHGDPPASMQAIYDYLHEKRIDEVKEVKRYQEMFKEG